MIPGELLIQNNRLRLENLPFYWRPLEKTEYSNFPKTLPFELHFDPSTFLYRQQPYPLLEETLQQCYTGGSLLAGLQDEEGIGRHYAEDILDFLERSSLKEGSVLEIGCGTGYLLHCLQQKKFRVLGYEPGFDKLGRFNIPVVNRFYTSETKPDEKFQFIIACNILEHLSNPEKFLQCVKTNLLPEGTLLLTVPDSHDFISTGDLGMLLHQHFLYFDKDSFHNLLAREGFHPLQIEKSRFGRALFGLFIQKKSNSSLMTTQNCSSDYFQKIKAHIESFEKVLERYKEKTIGIYVPLRALNLLYICRDSLKQFEIHLRFFDDYQPFHNRFLPCFDIPIEPGSNIIKNTPDLVLVFSPSFFDTIRSKISRLIKGTPPPVVPFPQ